MEVHVGLRVGIQKKGVVVAACEVFAEPTILPISTAHERGGRAPIGGVKENDAPIGPGLRITRNYDAKAKPRIQSNQSH